MTVSLEIKVLPCFAARARLAAPSYPAVLCVFLFCRGLRCGPRLSVPFRVDCLLLLLLLLPLRCTVQDEEWGGLMLFHGGGRPKIAPPPCTLLFRCKRAGDMRSMQGPLTQMSAQERRFVFVVATERVQVQTGSCWRKVDPRTSFFFLFFFLRCGVAVVSLERYQHCHRCCERGDWPTLPARTLVLMTLSYVFCKFPFGDAWV